MIHLIKKMPFRFFLLFLTSIFTCIVIFSPQPDRAIGANLKRSEVSLELSQSPNIPTIDTSTFSLNQKTTEELLEKRIIVINQLIDDDLARKVVDQLLYLESQASGKDIFIYINSPGGSVPSGMAIYDAMQFLRSDVVTVSTGVTASMASVILAAGTKGKRFALPYSQIMIHQPYLPSIPQGQAIDVEIQQKEFLYLKKQLNQLLADLTGQSLERIQADTEKDFFMSAQEAKAYGMIDKIVNDLPSYP